MMMLLTVIFLAIFEDTSAANASLTQVQSVNPTAGSFNGGTRITLFGIGFSDDKFNFGEGREHLGNTVFWVDDWGREFVCDMHVDGCTEGKLECYTKAMPASTYYPRVTVDGESVPLENICNDLEGKSSKCAFKPGSSNTPTISELTPNMGPPESVVAIKGLIRTDLYGTDRDLSSNGRTTRFTRIWASGKECQLLDKNGQLYGLALDGRPDMGTVNCQLSGTFVGNLRINYMLDSRYGRSMPDPDVFWVSGNNQIYMFQTFALIESLSIHNGCVMGGSIMTIRGSYFDPNNTKVRIGGVEADLQSVSDTSMEVLVPALPAELTYAANRGNRGMKLELILSQIGFPDYLNAEADNVSYVHHASYKLNNMNKFGARLSGFFVPPATGEYSFHIVGDDMVGLYMNISGDPTDGLEEILYSPRYIRDFISSERFILEGNKPYYMLGVVKQKYGATKLILGVHKYDTNFTAADSVHVKNEQIMIDILSNSSHEQQILEYPDSIAESAYINEIQSVSVNVPDQNQLGGAVWRLGMHTIYTGPLPGDASADMVKRSLMKLPCIHPDSVAVIKEEMAGGNEYTITFQSERGDFPTLQGRQDPNSAVDVLIVTLEVVKGVASGKYMTLSYGGVPSPITLLSNRLSTSKLEESIAVMFAPVCSRSITNPSGLAFSQSYELADPPYGRQWQTSITKEVPALCGYYTIKNPPYLYQWNANSNKADHFQLDTNEYFCFGHYGAVLEPQLTVGYYYYVVGDGSATRKGRRKSIDYTFEENEQGWSYNCFNLINLIRTNHGTDESIENVLFSDVRIDRVDKEQDVYVDMVSLASQLSTEDTLGQVEYERMLPVAPVLESVSVEHEADQNAYLINIETINCAEVEHLIEFANAEQEEGGQITISRISAASPPVTGTFGLLYRDRQLADIDVSLTTKEMRTLLESFFREGEMKVERSRDCYGFRYEVEWLENGGDKPNVTLTDVNVEGAQVNVELTQVQDGGVFWAPIPGDLLFTVHDTPQVTVTVNDIPSQCDGNCSFSWSESLNSDITDVSPASGVSGTIITIVGRSFGEEGASIDIGGAACAVTTVSDTLITCSAGEGPAGNHPVVVTVVGKGRSSGTFTFEYNFTVLSIVPTAGSPSGGTITTITGTGFASTIGVTFGGTAATISRVEYDVIVCVSPSGSGSADVIVSLGYEQAENTLSFNYFDSLLPEVFTLSETTASVIGGSTVLVTGRDFGGPASPDTVMLGEKELEVLKDGYTTSEMSLKLPSMPPGIYPLKITVPEKGYAKLQNAQFPEISYVLKVTKVFPTHGSLNGGTVVTVLGEGFGTDSQETTVHFDNTPCDVISVSETQLLCVIGPGRKVYTVRNKGNHPDAFIPQNLNAEVGDVVNFSWANKYNPITIKQTSDALQNIQMTGGFEYRNVPGKNGQYQIQLSESGMIHYWSGIMVDGYSMRGTINVEPAEEEDICRQVIVKLGHVEAAHDVNAEVNDPEENDSTCSRTAEVLTDCANLAASNTNVFSFCFRSCESAVVSSMEPQDGDASQTITLTGTGFSSIDCQNKVMLGSYECIADTTTATQITCSINTNGFPVGSFQQLTVTVANLGKAMLMNEMGFTAIPVVHSINPRQGSLHGGTLLTITGSGLCNSCPSPSQQRRKRQTVTDASASTENAVVNVGAVPCTIVSQNFGEIVCQTQLVNGEVSQDLRIAINSNGKPLSATCSSDCNYSYSTAVTPTITAPTETISGHGQILAITGTMLQTTTSVFVGSTECVISSAIATSVECNAGSPVAGRQLLTVITETGAANTEYVTVTGSITSLSPDHGSSEGETEIIINGFGFDRSEGNTIVQIDGSPCVIVQAESDMLQCRSQPHVEQQIAVTTVLVNNLKFESELNYSYTIEGTPSVSGVDPAFGLSGNVIQIIGTRFGSEAVEVTVGNSICEVVTVSDTSIACTLGDNTAGVYPVVVIVPSKGKASGSHLFEYQLDMEMIGPNEGSFEGGQETTVTGRGFNQNTAISICGSPCTAVEETTSTTFMCLTSTNDTDQDILLCDVVMTQGNSTSILTGGYTYSALLTATLSDVFPTQGGTGGGTTLTITGSGFSSGIVNQEPWGVAVSIGGAECVVETVAPEEIVCVTSAKHPSVEAPIKVLVGTKGLAKQGEEMPDFLYIDVWSSAATWGGDPPPVAGDMIVVPAGETLLIDVDTPVLKMLLINGGTVLFDDTKESIELQSEIVFIGGGGLMQIGSEEEPYLNRVVLTLHGHPRSKELPVYGTKGIFVRDGTFEAHGQRKEPSHTLLAQTVQANTDTITVLLTTNWAVGDEVVIATTGARHSQTETEQRTIVEVSNDGTTFKLDSALEHDHLGETVTVGDGSLEVRAEVGVLSRSILFRGSDDTQWHDVIEACPESFDTGEFATQTCFQGRSGEDVGSAQYGGHMLVHSSQPNLELACLRVSNVELTYVGQAFRLGRYAIHFHMVGHTSCSYVKNCAIHKSFNRVVNIHNTHGLVISDNVGYDIMGGAFFLEDGIETNNTFEGNLAVFVKSSTSLQNDDITPASFWITNPNNIVRNNRAVGGTHFGYWFRLHAHPSGASVTDKICPQKEEMGVFEGNSAHSFGWFGLWVFTQWTPMVDGGNCESTVPAVAEFNGFTAWNCEKGLEFVIMGAAHVKNLMLVNNEKAGFEWKEMKGVDPYQEERSGVIGDDSVIAAYAGPLRSETGIKKIGLVLPYSSGLVLNGLTFINYDEENAACFSWATIQGKTAGYNGGFETWLKNTEYINSPNRVYFRWVHEGVLRDFSGTLTGLEGGGVVLPDMEILPDSCRLDDQFYRGQVPGTICPIGMDITRFSWNKYKPTSLSGQTVNVTNQYGTTPIFYQIKRMTHKDGWMGLFPTNDEYTLTYSDGYQLSNISYDGTAYDLKENEYLIIKHVVSEPPDVFSYDGTEPNASVDSPLTSGSEYGDFYADANSISYILTGKGAEVSEYHEGMLDRLVTLNSYKCFFPNCIDGVESQENQVSTERPSDFLSWSSAKWVEEEGNFVISSSGVLTQPPEDANILIKKDTWVVLDAAEIFSISKLTVEGTLEFDEGGTENGSPCLQVVLDHLFINGGDVIAGWEQQPFEGCLEIRVRGHPFSPVLDLDSGPRIGSKAVSVFGGLDFHGRERTVMSRLAADISAGDDSLQVNSDVDWASGDEIAVAASGYMGADSEVVTITSVDGTTIVVTPAFQHPHSGRTIDINTETFSLQTEVALLTRNIRIIGQEYDTQEQDAFGARVIVSSFATEAGEVFTGYARLSHVEFHRVGQYGFTDPDDPRTALAFLNAVVDEGHPSSVTACTFHHGYNMGVGVYNTDDIVLERNVVQATAGAGFQIIAAGITLRNNLVMGLLYEGTLGDRELKTPRWSGAFETHLATDVLLEDNICAGSERGCFWIDGQACATPDSLRHSGNVAHSATHCVYVFPMDKDGVAPCTGIYGFQTWHCLDFAFYVQSEFSVEFADISSVGSNQGIHVIVIGPKSRTHEIDPDKHVTVTQAVFAGTPLAEFCSLYEVRESDPNYRLSRFGQGTRIGTWGKTGVVVPFFAAGGNGIEKSKDHRGIMTYPAIAGITDITDTTFAYYGDGCGGDFDAAIVGADLNDDLQHPVRVESLTLVDVLNPIYLPPPNVGKVNPSDCIDMDCDGLKKNLIMDLDGSILDSPGNIIGWSEFGWDDPAESSRGLGDYRIPLAALTDSDGNRIAVDELFAGKGIIRDSSCQLNTEWRAHVCGGGDATYSGPDYRMMIVESMDADSETRRVSPVALVGENRDGEAYVDLINGPQDHGWCSGYTCAKRLSIFPMLVSIGNKFQIWYAGSTPQNTRHTLLNAADTDTVLVGIWFAQSWRLDIYIGDNYIKPKNAELDANGETVLNDGEFLPDLSTDSKGANWFDKRTQLMWIVVGGGTAVDIKTTPMVMVSFSMPAMSDAEFFGEAIAQNFAAFFNIPASKIKVVKAVRESRRRRRRRRNVEESMAVDVIISDPPPSADATDGAENGTEADAPMSLDQMHNLTNQLLTEVQVGNISGALGVEVQAMSVTEPPLPTDSPEWQEASDAQYSNVQVAEPVVVPRPSFMRVSREAGHGYAGFALDTTPQLKVYDAQDNHVTQLGTALDPWQLRASLLDADGIELEDEMLLGNTASYHNGVFGLSDLAVTAPGNYSLSFRVISPSLASGYTASSGLFTVDPAPDEEEWESLVRETSDALKMKIQSMMDVLAIYNTQDNPMVDLLNMLRVKYDRYKLQEEE